MIAGLLLAAGAGRRFGGQKATAALAGRPYLRRDLDVDTPRDLAVARERLDQATASGRERARVRPR
jgi:CTP:molybdopterin cytidylyltransferase MocA